MRFCERTEKIREQVQGVFELRDDDRPRKALSLSTLNW